MKEALQNIRQSADALIAQAADAAAVDELRVRFLGKKGELTAILKQMGRLSAEERPVVGALANEVREAITADIARRTKELESAALAARLAAEEIDVTLPGKAPAQGKRHPFEQVLGELKEIFLGMGFDIVSGPEVELDHYNFEMLNSPRATRPGTPRIRSISPKTCCCARRPAPCRFARWKSRSRPSASSARAAFTAPTRWTPHTAPFSTSAKALWWIRA